ncbi:MAG: hypothetical protein K5681_06055 [Treponema sp.]|nr:hypothetical protein [Treponema sp.]
MKENSVKSERVVSIVGFVFLITAAVAGFTFNGDKTSFLEYIAPTKYIIPYTHVICAVLAFISIIFPSLFIMVAIFMIESVLTVMTHYDMLGIFFFYAAVILLLVKDIFTKDHKHVIIVLFIIHYLSLLGTLSRGFVYAMVSYAYSIFCMVFYLWIYSILKRKFSCYIPSNITDNSKIPGIRKGDVLKLSDFELTETQIQFVLANIHENLSFKDISEKYFVSVSVVKHEFVKIYKIFSVDNLFELRLLLLQYQVKA